MRNININYFYNQTLLQKIITIMVNIIDDRIIELDNLSLLSYHLSKTEQGNVKSTIVVNYEYKNENYNILNRRFTFECDNDNIDWSEWSKEEIQKNNISRSLT